MKTIGLIGGMSWESTQEYYRIITEETNKILGGLHSSKSILLSVDFAEIEKLQHEDNWEELTNVMIASAQSLERAGADFIVICTNTMHKMANEVQASFKIPLLH
jgi:aspartate racemase